MCFVHKISLVHLQQNIPSMYQFLETCVTYCTEIGLKVHHSIIIYYYL
jgi:hypothetical protein